jgi:hypothetical protein
MIAIIAASYGPAEDYGLRRLWILDSWTLDFQSSNRRTDTEHSSSSSISTSTSIG